MDSIPLLQLMHIPGIGHTTLNRLLHRMKGLGMTPVDLLDLSSDDLSNRFGLRMEWVNAFFANRDYAHRLVEELERNDIQILQRENAFFPHRLHEILGDSAPPVLFVRGNPSILLQKSVAIVGVRECSNRGERITQLCIERLVEEDIPIVSGNASGIDSVAHRSALENGGYTIFVIASGILHYQVRGSIADMLTDRNHVVVSEFPPRLPWATHAAMQRNRTICAFARAVLLVESGKSGGSFSSGVNALKFKIPLFVVNFVPRSSSAEGNLYFLHRGARSIPCNQADLTELIDIVREPDRSLNTDIQARFFAED